MYICTVLVRVLKRLLFPDGMVDLPDTRYRATASPWLFFENLRISVQGLLYLLFPPSVFDVVFSWRVFRTTYNCRKSARKGATCCGWCSMFYTDVPWLHAAGCKRSCFFDFHVYAYAYAWYTIPECDTCLVPCAPDTRYQVRRVSLVIWDIQSSSTSTSIQGCVPHTYDTYV